MVNARLTYPFTRHSWNTGSINPMRMPNEPIQASQTQSGHMLQDGSVSGAYSEVPFVGFYHYQGQIEDQNIHNAGSQNPCPVPTLASDTDAGRGMYAEGYTVNGSYGSQAPSSIGGLIGDAHTQYFVPSNNLRQYFPEITTPIVYNIPPSYPSY